LQATGRDARGRKQYRYHPDWHIARDESKYERLISFAQALPKLRRSVARPLRRRSFPRKKMLVCPHSLGVIDQDYHGEKDELMVQVQNIGTVPVTVERGERIAQGMFVKVEQATWEEVDSHNAATRGGFGSTGI